MLNPKLKYLFEAEEQTGFVTLKKTEIDDATLIKHLSVKPTEINIILARVASFIKGDREKAKKDLINDILEVMERSALAREFVGIGIQQNYHLFKGFPVRKGDPYEAMQDPNSEMVLKPSELYIGWMTDGSKAREDSIRYDAAKGEPIGGLLVDASVDTSKILFDINSVINTVKAKINVLNQYNNQAAPGKSLSKTNLEFLANDAPLYHGMWEIITTNKVTTVRVLDKWVWDQASGQKKVKWVVGTQQAPTQQQQQVKENMLSMFESVEIYEDEDIEEMFDPNVIDEALMQGIKNIFGSLLGTTRMKNVKKLSYFIKAHESEKAIYEKLIEFYKLLGGKDKEIEVLNGKIKECEQNIQEDSQRLEKFKTNKPETPAEPEKAADTPAEPDPIDKATADRRARYAKTGA